MDEAQSKREYKKSGRGHRRLSVVLCFVFSRRGLCDWPISRTEESYRLWCV
jgi:hypothetical protein